MVDRGEKSTSDARSSKLERPDAAPTESRSEVVSTDRSDAFSSDSSLNSGVDSQQNMEVHAKTQLQHKIGDSASNLMIPKLGTETFALVDEQNGIVHTGAGVLPRVPENITESYGENLKAIRPAKDESELQDSVAEATLNWMRAKGMVDGERVAVAVVHGNLSNAGVFGDLSNAVVHGVQAKTEVVAQLVPSVPPVVPSGPAPLAEINAQAHRMEHQLSVLANTPVLNQERRHLLVAVGQMTDPLARGRFYANMEAFEHRAANQHPKIAQQEMADTYREISRMLDAPAAVASVSQGFRELAAKQFMLHAAHPETISQGQTSNCHTTTMVFREMVRHPAALAETMATTTIAGAWTAPDGFRSVIAPNSLVPGPSEQHDPPFFDDRSYAVQLLHLALINDATQRVIPPGFYIERTPAPDHVEGEDWNNQWLLVNSVDQAKGQGISFNPSTMWNMAHNQFHDSLGIIVNASSVNDPAEAADPNLLHIRTKADLEHAIRDAKTHGRLPLIIAVDMMQLNPPHKPNGRDHVICITDIHKDGRVDILNTQRFPSQNRRATIPLEVLFDASASKKTSKH